MMVSEYSRLGQAETPVSTDLTIGQPNFMTALIAVTVGALVGGFATQLVKSTASKLVSFDLKSVK